MSFFEERLKESLKDPEFRLAWEESEEEYLKIRDEILLERLKQLEDDPESAVKWNDIKREE